MDKNQFRVLYKQFLFRVVDLEILSTSARGDANRLLGQFGTILIFASSMFALYALFLLGGSMPRLPAQRLAFVWGIEQFLIATTMLVVGLFGVLSWDSMFPDRRDVLILLPLSVRIRTLFFAKIAAVGAALGLAIAALQCFAGLIWPLVLAREQNFPGLIRSFAAYWITMLAAGAFIFCGLLCIQAVATLLPRRIFLRLSALLQLVAFWLFLTVYFLHPTMTPEGLTTSANHTLLAWVPIYWFFGLFQTLEGSSSPALTALASRAALGLLAAVLGICVAFLLSYLRTLQKTVEEPDITPGTGGGHSLPPFGKRPLTAIVQFSIRTLFRSRQHRLILSFFLGFGFTVVILYLKTPFARSQLLGAPGVSSWRTVNAPLIVSSIVIVLFSVIGMRIAFAMPTDLRANWVFRLTTKSAVSDYLKAVRRSLLVLAVAPVWIICAGVFFWLWPLRAALEQLGVLALIGMILVEACLWGFHKVPFTCSYLPGKAKIDFVILPATWALIVALDKAALLEQYALQNQIAYAIIISGLVLVTILLRWAVVASARSEGAEVRFEEIEPPVILELGLLVGGAPRTQPPRT